MVRRVGGLGDTDRARGAHPREFSAESPLGPAFGFVRLPPLFLGLMGLVVIAYVASAERAKLWFYRGACG